MEEASSPSGSRVWETHPRDEGSWLAAFSPVPSFILLLSGADSPCLWVPTTPDSTALPGECPSLVGAAWDVFPKPPEVKPLLARELRDGSDRHFILSLALGEIRNLFHRACYYNAAQLFRMQGKLRFPWCGNLNSRMLRKVIWEECEEMKAFLCNDKNKLLDKEDLLENHINLLLN